MDYRELEDLTEEIKHRYDENPMGWKIFQDDKNNVLIIGPDKGYRLKLIPLNPWKYTGVGISMKKDRALDQLRTETPSSGLRTLSKKDFERFISSMNRDGVNRRKIIKNILTRNPVSTQAIDEEGSQAVLSGPVISHPDLSTLSERQRELQQELKNEAEKLFRKKYPKRAGIYR